MEAVTHQEQVKSNYVIPDEMLGAFLMQGFYDRVHKLSPSGKVV